MRPHTVTAPSRPWSSVLGATAPSPSFLDATARRFTSKDRVGPPAAISSALHAGAFCHFRNRLAILSHSQLGRVWAMAVRSEPLERRVGREWVRRCPSRPVSRPGPVLWPALSRARGSCPRAGRVRSQRCRSLLFAVAGWTQHRSDRPAVGSRAAVAPVHPSSFSVFPDRMPHPRPQGRRATFRPVDPGTPASARAGSVPS